MKVIIAGSRNIEDFDSVERIIQAVCNLRKIVITEIVSGTASGVDELGEQYADKYNIPVKRFPADWNKYGKAAGPIRNEQMGRYADFAIVIWDGESRGSKHMYDFMKKINKAAQLIKLDDHNLF